jgi:hypothetical protein
VALEALSTDLLQWRVLLPTTTLTATTTTTDGTGVVFFCGNFGIILLHHWWLSDYKNGRPSALAVLEKMVQVTMMRGAQSGGVVSYYPIQKSTTTTIVRGVRSRVVNKKRTNLSKVLRRAVQRDVFSKHFPHDFVPVVSGHTRFATSSKATMQGTHPHQWTPPSYRRVYDFNVSRRDNDNTQGEQQQPHVFVPRIIKVENYITHNGDFEFYTVNGKTYDMENIQKWLVAVTGIPLPASVDSVAVAGMIDLLRTQGCFALSARYAICLGLRTSSMQDTLVDFPLYSHFEKIGEIFEQVLAEMLKTTSLEKIGDSPDVRHSFALRVLSRLEAHSALIKPLGKFITDQEEGASLLSFCLLTIDVSSTFEMILSSIS